MYFESAKKKCCSEPFDTFFLISLQLLIDDVFSVSWKSAQVKATSRFLFIILQLQLQLQKKKKKKIKFLRMAMVRQVSTFISKYYCFSIGQRLSLVKR
jgi:hypothetical protein